MAMDGPIVGASGSIMAPLGHSWLHWGTHGSTLGHHCCVCDMVDSLCIVTWHVIRGMCVHILCKFCATCIYFVRFHVISGSVLIQIIAGLYGLSTSTPGVGIILGISAAGRKQRLQVSWLRCACCTGEASSTRSFSAEALSLAGWRIGSCLDQRRDRKVHHGRGSRGLAPGKCLSGRTQPSG